MRGRKPAVNPDVVVNAVLHFKEGVVIVENGEKKIVVATNKIWTEVRNFLNGSMTTKAIHTFVQQDRYGIKEKLGFPIVKALPISYINDEECNIINQFDDDSSDITDKEDLPKKKFVFTFSPEEWQQIQPQQVTYKIQDKMRPTRSSRCYFVLPKMTWTPLLAEHFWTHTELPCCLAFRRAKVYASGQNYIEVIGRCTICESHFKGIVSERPPENARVLMHCIYTGNFYDTHKSVKKRRMVGPAFENALSSIKEQGGSSESYREKEANRLMKPGNSEPTIVPTGGALRTLKWRQKLQNKRHPETLTALAIMKTEDDFKDVLNDMGGDPFFLHYHSGHQTHLYRSYCRHTKYPKLIIDATGSVINNFKKFGTNKTHHVFLYEALVHDSIKMHSFTVTNMLSERHSNVAIYNWLSEWVCSDVPRPKETICDQSLALLSAVVQCFTQYSSLQEYVNVCADLILGDLSFDSHWLPKCFVRMDVAHFIKLASKWIPLKPVPRRVREVVLRTIGLLVKCQSLNKMYALLFSLFVVLINDTDGNDLETGVISECEKHKILIIQATSTGFINFEEQFNEIIAAAQTEDEARELIEKEFELQYEGLDNYSNPFQSWAQDIFEKSKHTIREGTGINPMYLPTVVPMIIKCMKLLPLWSGIMIPVFGYGSSISSSAAVESNFNKIKNTTFKHIALPTDVEVFLEQHIASLRGSSLLRLSHQIAATSSPEDNNINDKNNTNGQQEEINNTNCALCKTGNLPAENGAYKCIICNIPVHALPSCSTHKPGEETLRVCFTCSQNNIVSNNLSKEDISVETWSRRPKSRGTHSYLCPNSILKHIRINNTKNTQSLPIIKNGSRADELKSCTIRNVGKVVFSNTCAFDTIASILMVSYSDSNAYSNKVDTCDNIFLKFAAGIVRDGITARTYTDRAEILMEKLQPDLELISYDLMLASCNTTAGNIFHSLLCDLPTKIETVVCNALMCKRNQNTLVPFTMLMYNTDGKELINGLQEFLDKSQQTETTECRYVIGNNNACNGQRTTTVNISDMHLFIEIINWKGESNNYSTEVLPQLDVQLKNIPEVLISSNRIYELRGVGCFRRGQSRLRTSIGHYYTYCKRGPNWELYDDLQKKPKKIRENLIVPCEYLVYTI